VVVADFKYLPISSNIKSMDREDPSHDFKKYSAMGISSRGFFINETR
jgi:hypothetical protein